MYDKNPAYCINVLQNGTRVFFRATITAEVSPDGSTLITDPDKFKYSMGAQMYRIEASKFPIANGSLNISALRNAVLETYEGGKYTSSLSGCVSPV